MPPLQQALFVRRATVSNRGTPISNLTTFQYVCPLILIYMSSKKVLKELNEAVKFLQKQYKHTPKAGVVLGSGLSSFTDEIEIEKEVAYGDIPHFPVSTVEGHKSKMIFGRLGGKMVVAMAGRFHFYEGYDIRDVVFPIRVMKLLGIETLFLSNAAGSVNPSYKVGDLMIITDHISLFTPNPLIGKNIDELGPRFPDMSEPYKLKLIEKAKEIAAKNNYDVREECVRSSNGSHI